MSDYEPSESESDYDENEKILLNNVRKRYEPADESEEEEVYNVAPSEDDSEPDDIELNESDIEGQDEDDDLPNEKAWGKDRRKFYSTDYVDPDYGGFNEKDAQLAELEEEEARKLQMKLAQQLDDDDFEFDLLKKDVELCEDEIEEKIKVDFTKLSKREKIHLLKKESPELFKLLDDFKGKLSIYRDFLKPVLAKYRKGKLTSSSSMEFVQTFSDVILNYCVNIYMYLLLKSNRTPVDNHPVIKRLYQYHQLIGKLEPVFEDRIKQQIAALSDDENSHETGKTEKKKKKLKLLEAMAPHEERKKKKVKFVETILKKPEVENIDKAVADEVQEEPKENEEDNKLEKRAITYQIAKNKGLTPHRKKEQRNPRVKHRNKFRKAKIRRKGAVREVRHELQRYGGEISGIKATVSKSIKLKS